MLLPTCIGFVRTSAIAISRQDGLKTSSSVNLLPMHYLRNSHCYNLFLRTLYYLLKKHLLKINPRLECTTISRYLLVHKPCTFFKVLGYLITSHKYYSMRYIQQVVTNIVLIGKQYLLRMWVHYLRFIMKNLFPDCFNFQKRMTFSSLTF